ncbi:CRISPR-associated endonuclease Cas2 [Helicobacter valdiviensis]|uniref:CRISPR-associated endoribonuclease Cas2 n=1 Tax=Helicobacter valdiviensis TaxID=1458358 RepID=A0A2W6MWQ3_9HELI|nr:MULTISPECIES: CRISPR-associated endonuclease Cas2 [Helicobacter]PZT48837.1 CRISPR-associated endonuclease Cas2 [Helicobacter valdiviensis]
MIEDKFMRVLLMFDMPTVTKQEQKYANKFRKNLIKLGYFMLQFSVYMRITKGIESAKNSIEAVKRELPPFGNIRALIVTEKQFDNMQLLLGNTSFNEDINQDKNLALFCIDNKGDYQYKQDKYGKDKPKETQNRKDKFKQPKLFEF